MPRRLATTITAVMKISASEATGKSRSTAHAQSVATKAASTASPQARGAVGSARKCGRLMRARAGRVPRPR